MDEKEDQYLSSIASDMRPERRRSSSRTFVTLQKEAEELDRDYKEAEELDRDYKEAEGLDRDDEEAKGLDLETSYSGGRWSEDWTEPFHPHSKQDNEDHALNQHEEDDFHVHSMDRDELSEPDEYKEYFAKYNHKGKPSAPSGPGSSDLDKHQFQSVGGFPKTNSLEDGHSLAPDHCQRKMHQRSNSDRSQDLEGSYPGSGQFTDDDSEDFRPRGVQSIKTLFETFSSPQPQPLQRNMRTSKRLSINSGAVHATHPEGSSPQKTTSRTSVRDIHTDKQGIQHDWTLPVIRKPEQRKHFRMTEARTEDQIFQTNQSEPIPQNQPIKVTNWSKIFMEQVERLNMKKHLDSKLTLGDVLSIGIDNLLIDQPQDIQDIPWHFLTKIIGLNRTARNIQLQKQSSKEESDDESELFLLVNEIEDPSCSIHPLDVLCILLHCSDLLLQQEIITKMSMCQFAVPLLVPLGDGSGCTFMLWAMRDIVKKWRPQSLSESKGFREDNVVNIEMPIFSFVRLGPNKLSKSKLLNQVLNPAQQHHDFFIHDNMEGGNIERKISDGLVEMSWYFPCGKSDVFSEPIAAANLRGDLESNWEQFTFLTRISLAIFIFVESMCERQLRLLSSCDPNDTKFYFIVTPGPGKAVDSETQKLLQKFMVNLKVCKKQFIVKRTKANDAEYVQKIQNSIEQILKEHHKKSSLEDIEAQRSGLHIDVDEDLPGCQKAREYALNITSVIDNVDEYKKKALNLQGDLWKKLSKIEKELCRMTNREGKDVQQYQDELIEQRNSLHKKQYEHDLSEGMMLFISAITELSQDERQYFLKWMKLELEKVSRNNLSALQAEYKKLFGSKFNKFEELKQIDQKIADSSLGIEHFLRELGQFYEAECSMIKQRLLPEYRIQFAGLPKIASDLFLDGLPLELIDGDASNIPLQWITDVLTELDKKTGGQCRMRVITVLGVRSTGKSTLLNTMFGLQFPVASGRCTRGAFMTLIKVKENFKKELRCEFILVIDTEGLKSPELASLEDSYEHDYELATLVVGLSDITIVNMAMENITEIKDILHTVVHAFLRMKEIGKKPNCQFVHQNVSDVSAHDKNRRDRKKLLEQLNEMTKVAVTMEQKTGMTSFCDVMDYDPERHNWYIPGLWHGVPPMAPVNFGYSENVYKLKQDLLTFMKTQNAPYNIPDFIKWVESLWNAVKHEKCIFSYRNSPVAEAYGKLSIQN